MRLTERAASKSPKYLASASFRSNPRCCRFQFERVWSDDAAYTSVFKGEVLLKETQDRTEKAERPTKAQMCLSNLSKVSSLAEAILSVDSDERDVPS